MLCRQAAELVRCHEADLLNYLLSDPEGAEVEATVSNCSCEVCLQTANRIQSAGVRARLRIVQPDPQIGE